MKHLITLIAAMLFCTTGSILANENSGLSLPSVTTSQDAGAKSQGGSKRVTTRRRKPFRRRCRRVVIAPLKGAATTTATGLTYIVTRNTLGRQPQAGETVLVNYTGLLGSGVKFDSSLDRGQPFEFPLGRGRVIKGWDEGIGKLRVGEQATLIIPAQLGYGDRGAGGVIPPNATLIFLVELVGIKETSKTNP